MAGSSYIVHAVMGTYLITGEKHMENTAITTTRSIRANDIFGLPPEPKREELCKYQGDFGELHGIFSNTITIALSRDLQKNVMLANAVALHLAMKYPDRNVLLVNTYAGTEMMQRTLADAAYRELINSGRKAPTTFREFLPKALDEYFDEQSTFEFPENLRVLNAPTGTLTAANLASEIEECHADTLILNSFEFSAWSIFLRAQFAQGLVGLQKRLQLTVVVFSHELRSNVGSFRAGRGPLGLLAAYAYSVWHAVSFEETQRLNRSGNRTVHEKQTQMRKPNQESSIPYECDFSNAAGIAYEE